MPPLHRLLESQLKRHFGDSPSLPPEWQAFIDLVNEAYWKFEEDRIQLERSLDLRSREMIQADTELRAVLNAFPDLFLWVDPEGIILDCRGGSTSELHLPREQVIGKKIQSIPEARLGEKIQAALKEVQNRGEMASLEYSLWIDEEELYFEARFMPLSDQNVLCVIRNITERKKAEQKLVQSEERFRGLVENAPFGISIMNRDQSFEYFNSKFTEIFGYTLSDLPDREAWFQKAYPDAAYRKSVKAAWKIDIPEALQYGINPDRIFTVRCKDGRGRMIHFQAVIMKNEPVIMFYEDVTNRFRAEEELRRSREEFKELYEEAKRTEAVYRSLIHSSADAIVIYDLEGRVTYLSPSFTRVFGWTLEELWGRKIPYVPPDQETATNAVLHSVVEKGLPCQGFESQRYTKDRRLLEVSISSSRFLDHQGRPSGILVLLRDITDSKKLEQRLRVVEKMEALGNLAGGVAHDLNNILSGLVSYPELLLLDMAPENPLREPILTIQASGLKAAAIVQDLLALARRGVPKQEVLNLNRVVHDYLQSPEFEGLALYHPRVEIKTRLSAYLRNLLGSPVHLSKMIMNLVNNAVEAMPEGGTVTLTTENRVVDRPLTGYERVEEGEYVTLTVADRGIGIGAEDIPRIFEPFYTKKVMGRSGSGLGMAVVWGTVKDHKGYVDLQSEVGRGTTVTIYLPVTRKTPEEVQPVIPLAHYRGQGERILVVDDLKEQREIVLRLLQELGYAPVGVSSGEEAVEYLKKQRVDLLLLDMIMEPGMDGLDTLKEVLRLHPDQRTVLVSGFSETDRVKEAQRLSGGLYLQKPYRMQELGLAVKATLARQPG